MIPSLLHNRATRFCCLRPLVISLTRSSLSSTARMSTASSNPAIDPATLASFQAHLDNSNRILALLGAGLSAASGLPTFRGAGGIWRNRDAVSLATPDAFDDEPGLVWQFYSYRRHMALHAKPNPAHYALAELARKKENFLTISQNVDGLSQRASHPPSQLKLLHGNLFDIKCWNEECDYMDYNNQADPLIPAFAATDVDLKPSGTDTTGVEASSSLIAATFTNPNHIPEADLPHCPRCNNLLRPGVVWFSEALPDGILEAVDAWSEEGKIDLMLVIGTAANVFPAAGYISKARATGARIAVINMDAVDLGAAEDLREEDWMFQGDAGVIVPELLKGVIGELKIP